MFYFVEEIVSYTHRAGDNVLPHIHGGAEIIVYGGGEGAATVEKEEFNYSEKSLLIVPEGREHFERTLVETDVRSCVFRTDYFEIGEPVMITGAKFAPLIDRIYEILGKMSEIFLVEGVRGGAELENDLSQLLYTVRYLKEVYDGSFDTQAVALCSNAKKYIFANFDREIAFEILAENVGYSYDRFRHIFVEVVGMGPKAYQQGIRMSNAKKLLTFTSKRVREIAAMCGYGNPVCFMNYFKNSMGISPSQYRKLSRSQARNKTFNFKAEE